MTSVRGLARVKYVKVAVNSGRPTFMTFSYAIPPGRDVARGDVVHVPFGQRTLQGVVVDGPVDMPGYDPDAVRPLEPPVADAPRITPERVRLAAWVRDYYLAPPWEAHALFLPPGAGERPRSALVRAAVVGEPAALSAYQAAIFDALDVEEPREIDELKRDLRTSVPARNFDAAVTALVRRQLAERRYALGRPRGRARVAEVARLAVAPDDAAAYAAAIEGRRPTPEARALRALAAAGGGPLPAADVVRVARDAEAVAAQIAAGELARDGDGIRLALDDAELATRVRELSRSQVDRAGVALLEQLVTLARDGDDGGLPVRALNEAHGAAARTAVTRLAEAGLIRVDEVLDRRDPLRDLQVVRRPPVELIGDQRGASTAIRAAIDRRDGTGIVLRGVTGSGKTEVYLDALRHAVDEGYRGIVLVPEIALTPQTVRRFAERFPGRVGVLHSGLSLGEAFDEWHEIAAGAYDVVIGSRSATFAPQPDLGLIVIDEAHEWTYKQHDPAPRYDARTVAAELARQTGAAVVYGSATPDVERWYAADSGELERVDLPQRMRPVHQTDGSVRLWPRDDLPSVDVVDMRGSRSLFSPELVDALGEVIDREEQAILFLNRRGLAGYLLCPSGHSPMCSSCDVSLALHAPNRLICHQCGRSKRLPPRCDERACELPLRQVRAGTERVVAEVRTHFPTARVERWDRDTARTAADHEQLLNHFMRHEADVLVGTQMVAKGLDLPLVTLVGVVLADYTLREGDFRAAERTFQLLVQVSGRAGRAERDGHVIIQTMQPDDRAVVAAATHDLDAFYEAELAWRAEHGYPPFSRMVRLVFGHTNATFAVEEARRLADELRTRAVGMPNVTVDGPLPPQVARVRGRYRWAILLRGDDPASVIDVGSLPPGWTVDVDPLVVS